MNARTTTVAEPGWVVGLVWVGFPVFGAGVVWLIGSVAGWVASLAWAPFQGLFRLVDSVPEPQATFGALGVGAVGGLVLAFLAEQDRLRVEVADEHVVFTRGGEDWRHDRTLVSGVFLDGKRLVLLGLDGEELAREKSDLDAEELSDVFQARGYPWLEGDPFRDEYRRWVAGTPDLPPGADALLRVRAAALRKHEDEDAAQLRGELARLGVVVREERKRQFWRLSGRPHRTG